MSDFDVVIVGGAMTGASLALALANSDSKLKVALIEASDPTSQSSQGFDARAIALSHGSIAQLRRLGIWPHIQNLAEPISRIEVSDKGHAGATEMNAADYGIEQLGAVIELESVGQALQQALHSTSITLFHPDSITELKQQQQLVSLTLASGKQLTAKLVVAADGTFSKTCEQIGLTRTVTPFEQHAIIANIETEQAHQQRAFERFTQHGPVALLPMRPEIGSTRPRMSLVMCVNDQDTQQVLALDDEQFIHRLQQEFGWRLGAITKVGKRSSYPLSLHQRKVSTHHRVVAIGNAAQTLHPIAGQGFNLGFRDVVTLFETLQQADAELGGAKQLLDYRYSRQVDVETTVALTESLVRLFSNNNIPLQASRNIGLFAMDWLEVVKQPFVERTLGWVATRN